MLGIHYRVLDIAAGDLGAPASPASTTSRRGCRARRGGIGDHLLLQLHRLPGAPPQGALPRPPTGRAPVHTLNGTAVAVGRTIIAIAENHGGEVPDVLKRFGAPPRLV